MLFYLFIFISETYIFTALKLIQEKPIYGDAKTKLRLCSNVGPIVMNIPTSKLQNENQISPAERVVKATNYQEILSIMSEKALHLPGEEIKHYETQYIHMKKRQITATNALKRLSKFLIGISSEKTRSIISNSTHFLELCICALYRLPEIRSDDISNYGEAIQAIATFAPFQNTTLLENLESLLINISSDIAKQADITTLTGIERSIIRFNMNNNNNYNSNDNIGDILRLYQKELSKYHLPFKLLPGLLKGKISITEVLEEVPFTKDTFTTINGKKVTERRETCWMAEFQGGLSYSGKVMSPHPFSPCIARIRDEIEISTGVRYDCCLINHYPDGECACKFHSDPDHGCLWSQDTVVVSIGETRRFNLRQIILTQENNKNLPSSSLKSEVSPHSFHVFDGDVFYMFGTCQDTYQHCVMKSEGEGNNGARCSVVFKKSLPLANGRRGHGLPAVTSISNQTITSSSKLSDQKIIKNKVMHIRGNSKK